MAGVLRRLVTEVVLEADKALRGLKAYDTAWKNIDKTVASVASNIEKNAARASAVLAGLSTAAAGVRAGGGGGSRGPRAPSPEAAAAKAEKAAKKAEEAQYRQTQNEEKAAIKSAAAADKRAQAEERATDRILAAKERAAVKAAEIEDRAAAKAAKAASRSSGSTTAPSSVGGVRGIGTDMGHVAEESSKAAKGIGIVTVALGDLASKAVSWGKDKIVGALQASTAAAVDFESAMIDLSKVTKGTDDSAEGFDRLKKGIIENSKALGRMPKEIAELTAALAPVFSGKEDLTALAADVTKIGVAWGVSGAEAGQYFADISRGMGLTATETKALFGSINELANEMGLKAKDIAEATQRASGVIKAAGLSAQTGAALNATLIAAGASSDIAATGVKKFVSSLEAGVAATPTQMKAFEALGFSAEQVGEKMSKGGKEAEDQIIAVVTALGELPQKDTLPVLIELFGSESIGSIGAAATAVDALGQSFKIAGNKVGAATSVEKEFNKVSAGSAFAIDKLKANIGVLAVSLGEKLLPYVNQIVAWLTSKEGQEWGAAAVEKAVSVVTFLAEAIGGVISVVSGLTDVFGGATVAIVAMGAALTLALGPWGALAAAAVATIGLITSALKDTSKEVRLLEERTKSLQKTKLFEKAGDKDYSGQDQKSAEAEVAALEEDLRQRKEKQKRASGILSPKALQEEAKTRAEEAKQIELQELNLANAKQALKNAQGKREELAEAATKKTAKDEAEKAAKDAAEKAEADEAAASQKISDEIEFDSLNSRARKGALNPEDAKRRTELSKSLNLAKPKSGGGGGRKGAEKFASDSFSPEEKLARLKELEAKGKKGRKPSEDREMAKLSKETDTKTHELTKDEIALQNLSPELAGVIGDGNGGVGNDIVSKAVFGSATKGKHAQFGDIKESITPGPSIKNTYNNQTVSTIVNQTIDARSNGGGSDGIGAASQDMGNGVGKIVWTGVADLLAIQNGGGKIG